MADCAPVLSSRFMAALLKASGLDPASVAGYSIDAPADGGYVLNVKVMITDKAFTAACQEFLSAEFQALVQDDEKKVEDSKQ